VKDIMNDEERKQQEESAKRIDGAKEFSRTIRGMMAQIVDLEERMIRIEKLHHELGGKRVIRG